MSTTMPDIAAELSTQHLGTLDWVGMSEIDMPLMLLDEQNNEHRISARIDAYVSLDVADAKGIHMSRLYLALEQLSAEGHVSISSLRSLLESFLATHQGLSQSARVVLRFDYHLRRPSLLSGNVGWKAYPVELNAEMIEGQFHCDLSLDVTYSSTCPCSAALARQLIQDAFQQKFADTAQLSKEDVTEWLGTTEGIVATPHSQRSVAEMKVRLTEDAQQLPLVTLIDSAEEALKTPVQAAVKREDEQEFARLNGQNNMFCEDAARILKHRLNNTDFVADFRVRVNHYESLHAHDAVSIVTKGLTNGFKP
ncbi:GTP cyclohydrolase I FolE2 [Aliidiomarina taiwanensis]|uniref:GTP cyclohydrolase FolE2 n=1 Tax=Aliidiomarina taiwanensis TaxID=946228 RepID=A0A432X808_9GAMM|nr:GTP cyclohydrolase FolE2 [Aliidiomarina taiwanensis]RUO42946.1 GTP cyclohydrolase I FolE2 [Aliidiomarina taiwanensis]